MRIGVDVRNLTQDLTGTSRFVFEIIKNFSKQNKKNIYYFSPSPIKKIYKNSLNIKNLKESFYYSPILRFLWGKYFLTNDIKKKKLNIFWGAAHRIPRYLPKNIGKIVTIFDTLYLDNPELIDKFSWIKEFLTTPQAIKEADIILVPSKSTQNSIIKHFGAKLKKKIKIISLGGDLRKKKIKIPKNHVSNFIKPYLLFVGSVSPRKNLRNFLISFSKLPNNLKNSYNIVIIGNYNFENRKLKEFSLSLNLHVFFFKNLNDTQVNYFYKNAEYLILPSLNEGFGLPIVEAQSCETPVITSNIYSMPEIAGKACYLVSPYSINNIKTVLTNVLSDKKKRDIKAKLCLKNSEEYKWSKTACKIYEIAKELYISKKSKVV